MDKTIETLRNKGVVLTGTDTTFGLSCVANDIEAVKKIDKIKNRPENKNYILLVENDAHLEKLVEVPTLAWDIIDLSDKPVTLIYDKILDVPEHLISPEGTIGIRVTQYKPLQRIIQKLKTPIVSTSANLSGETTPQSFSDINAKILEEVDYIMPEARDFVPTFDGSSVIQIKHDGQIKVIRP